MGILEHKANVENTAVDECFLHLLSLLECPECLSQFNMWPRLLHLVYQR